MAFLDVPTLVEELIFTKLKADATVTTLLKGTDADATEYRIYPTTADTGVKGPLVSHDAAGWQIVGRSENGKPTFWRAFWDLTFWQDGWDRISLRATIVACLDALIGADMAGIDGRHVAADGTAFAYAIRYGEPVPGAPDQEGAGVWQRITHRLVVEVAA